jgi:ATP-dependent RNA helicase DHX37/DHR1
LLVGHEYDCIHYAIAMVAALSAQEIFVPESQAIPSLGDSDDAPSAEKSRLTALRSRFNSVQRRFCHLDEKADAIKMLQVVGEFAHCPTEHWCDEHFVRFKTMKEIQKLRKQIVGILRNNIKSYANLEFKDRLPPPTDKQVSALKSMVTAGFVDQIAIRADLSPTPPQLQKRPSRAIDVPYRPLISVKEGPKDEFQGLVYVHPASPLGHLSVKEMPKFVVFSYLQRATQGIAEKRPKTRMHALTDIGEKALGSITRGTPLVEYGKPLRPPTETSGPEGRIREGWFEPRLCYGREEWPLPAAKVKQKKFGDRWVTIGV